jgi:hypothetical protein
MRFTEFKLLAETAEEIQDIAQISRTVLDFLNDHPEYQQSKTGMDMDLNKIPGIRANTPNGQLIIDGVRLSFGNINNAGQTWDTLGRGPAGVERNPTPGLKVYTPSVIGQQKDGSGTRNPSKYFPSYFDADHKLHVELNKSLDFKREGPYILSLLAHEFTHDLDVIKGSPTSALQQKVNKNTRARDFTGPLAKDAPKDARYNPKVPTDYMQNVYQWDPVEINARFSQAAIDIGSRVSSGDTPEQVRYIFQDAFAKNTITYVMIPKDVVAKLQDTPGTTYQDYWKEALKNPEFRRLMTRAYQVVQAEEKNSVIAKATMDIPGTPPVPQPPPLPEPTTPPKPVNWYDRGYKSKGFIDRTLNDPHQNPFKDLAERVTRALDQLFKGEFVPFVEKLKSSADRAGKAVIDDIKASKGVSGAALWGVQKVLVPVATAYAIYDGFTQIREVPTSLPEDEYRKQVTKIVAKLVAEFGIGWVAAIAGAFIAGAAGTAIVPGLGTAAAALTGFIAGGVAGITANYFLGDSVEAIVDKVVEKLYKPNTDNSPQNVPRTGAQGAANARNAVKNFSTAGNPKPVNESLARIIELAVVKKPT